MKLHVGTSGYAYKEWRGHFYPEDITPKEMLRSYAERLKAVEINYTFYHMPTEKVLLSWLEQVPGDFVFTLKASQMITHRRRMKNAGSETEYLFKTVSVLGDKLGAVLFQFPPNFPENRQRLEEFLPLIPKDFRCAFEFRHESWLKEEIADLLGDAGHCLCTADSDDLPAHGITGKGSWGYLRLRRSAFYTEADVEWWAARVCEQKWERTFVFFDHEYEARGALEAIRLAELATCKT